MSESDVWPVVFVGWRSKTDEFISALKKGQLDAWTGKLHVRKGAPFVAVLEDGTLLGRGTVVKTVAGAHELSISHCVSTVSDAPILKTDLKDKVLAIPRPFLRGPITSIIIVPNRNDAVLDIEWFNQVLSGEGMLSESRSAVTVQPLPAKPPQVTRVERRSVTASDNENESLLKGWIPPALQGLLADHVRADQWELMVAYALRSLGCQVKYLGKEAGPKPVPDCIARYTSPSGQVIELVVDAKAGQWNGAVDDIRAMRDYVELATPYSYPLFVANSLTKDVPERLRQHVMNGKIARAICGRDLALLITQRLTDPNFNVEFELRRFFL